MRRGSGINPKVYSWWYRNRKVRNRSRASTHIALSDLPWRRYQAAREIWRKEASQHRVDCAESGRVGGGEDCSSCCFRVRVELSVSLSFFSYPGRQIRNERTDLASIRMKLKLWQVACPTAPLRPPTSATSGKALNSVTAAGAGPASTCLSKLDHNGQGTDERPLFLFWYKSCSQ